MGGDLLVSCKSELNGDLISCARNTAELPEAVACDAVGGVLIGGGGMGIKPRPAKGDAASNGFSFLVNRSGRGVENGVRGVPRLPVGEMGSMEGEGGRAGWGLDLESGVVWSELSEGNAFGKGQGFEAFFKSFAHWLESL